MLRQALYARGGLFSKIYRPRHSEMQRCLITDSQRRAFHVFPGLRYNDHNNSYAMILGRIRSLSTTSPSMTSPNSSYRGMLPKSNTEFEAMINDIETKLQQLESKINTKTESRLRDTEFNLWSVRMHGKDIPCIYKSLSELRSDHYKLVGNFYMHKIWQLYFVIAGVALYVGYSCTKSLADCNEELAEERRENKQREETLAIEQ
ncbi:hypothetical protein VE02_08103 [Pseudogymnoascus sp. 03VT05]|nr:hypothetical protein VE02_08103 [Pseudogymnoascus sp. 03VT05]